METVEPKEAASPTPVLNVFTLTPDGSVSNAVSPSGGGAWVPTDSNSFGWAKARAGAATRAAEESRACRRLGDKSSFFL